MIVVLTRESTVIRGVPIFVDFGVDINHEIWYPTKYKFSADLYCGKSQTTKLKNPWTNDFSAIHENWHPRIKVLSQYIMARTSYI